LTEKLIVKMNRRKIVRYLGVIIIILTIAHVSGQFIKLRTSDPIAHGLIAMFNVDLESNVPTYFSSLMLLIISVLLGIIAQYKNKTKGPYFIHWTLLSIAFLFLSLDEAAGFHEGISGSIRTQWDASGYFQYPWVIPGIFLVLIFVILFFKFWLNLPQKTRMLFLVSGVIYISGAIGIELISGKYAYIHGEDNLVFNMIIMIEEFLEMSGCLCFIYALLRYIEEYIQNIQICFINKKN